MFVKKDLRKIPQILEDATSRAVASPPDPAAENDKHENDGIVHEMRFARRAPEFLPSCNVSLLLQPKFQPALENLMQLSLYDCGLQTLAGVELSVDRLGSPLFPKLEQLDIGRNPKLTNDSIPDTFHTQFPQLTQLWLDDCSFGPNIPSTLLDLNKLQVVRMTGNKLQGELEDGIGIRYWKDVKVLALDGNKLRSVGKGLGKLKELDKLHLRGNELMTLPEGVPGSENVSLTMLSLSSNQLKSLPTSLVECTTLKELYLNGNQIEELPNCMAEKLVGLKKFNLAHNSIGKGMLNGGANFSQISTNNDGDVTMEDANYDDILPGDFVERFGMPDAIKGDCSKDDNCVVRMQGNPLAEAIRKRHLEEEKRRAKEAAAAAAMEAEAVE